MAPKFALFTKGSKLPLNKGFKNMFELLQSCAQPSVYVLNMYKKHITKTYLYNFAHPHPLKPYFYIEKLGFTGVYIIFLIFAQKQIEGSR